MRSSSKPTNNAPPKPSSVRRPIEMVPGDRLKPPPLGDAGVLLLPPLLPLFVFVFGTPDMAVGVWLLSEEVGVVPGCAVEVG